jgi:hypothetical protein
VVGHEWAVEAAGQRTQAHASERPEERDGCRHLSSHEREVGLYAGLATQQARVVDSQDHALKVIMKPEAEVYVGTGQVKGHQYLAVLAFPLSQEHDNVCPQPRC